MQKISMPWIKSRIVMLAVLVAGPYAAVLVFSPSTLSGQEIGEEMKQIFRMFEEEQVFELGEFVPSSGQPFGPISSVIEITAQDILDQNVRNVGEALRFVPGVIYGRGGASGFPRNEGSIIMRGVGPRAGLSGDDKKYSVFIDGRSVYEPFLGTVDLFHLPIDNVAKIKIVKGPVDAPYGPNTLGGVVNIITKKGTKETTTQVNTSYERHNTQDYWVEHGGQRDKLNYYLVGSIRKSNGFSLASDFTPTSFEDRGLREESGFNKQNLSLNLGYDFTKDDKIAFLSGYYKADPEIPVPTTGYKVFASQFGRFTDWRRYFVDLSGETRFSNLIGLRGTIYFDKFDNELTFFTDQTFSVVKKNSSTGGDVISIFDNYGLGTNLQATVDVAENIKVKAGTFLKKDVVNKQRDSASPFEDFETLTTDYFMDAEYLPFKNLMVTGGFNYDTLYTLHSFFARTDQSVQVHSFNPLASVIFKPWSKTRLHTAIAKKSNMPRMQNLFGQSAGNIDLKAENNRTFEIGANQLFWDNRIEAEVTYFQNRLNNVIELQDRPGGPILVPFKAFAEFANSDSFKTRGFEILLSAKLARGFSSSVDYTYLASISEGRGASLDARFTGESLDPRSPLLERPRHQVNINMKYVFPFGLSTFLQGSYISESFDSKALASDPSPDRFDHNDVVKVGSFLLLNGKTSYEVWKGVKPYLAVENLLDTDYERIRGFPQPGRSFFFGVNIKF